ncbi:hypothetical protein XELAEV_18029998mg [Xenopus laevis]|uniref:Uncharacterized protein n=1 Tax=Xenopus laevis TaxID=8355 RepID=A0A974CSS6_XENLA|nr:hypothetical protein XELAEV_18029998mg [Xenopus laevis]
MSTMRDHFAPSSAVELGSDILVLFFLFPYREFFNNGRTDVLDGEIRNWLDGEKIILWDIEDTILMILLFMEKSVWRLDSECVALVCYLYSWKECHTNKYSL